MIVFATGFVSDSAGMDVVGTIRPQNWARLLPGAGWLATVVTGGSRYQTLVEDQVVVRILPSSSVIADVKTRARVDNTSARIAGRRGVDAGWGFSRAARSSVREIASLVPDHLAWALRAARSGVSLARSHDADAVFSTSPSPAAHLAAWIVAVESGLPWVAELRDLWAQAPQGRGDTRLRRLPDMVAERLLFRRASALVTVSDDLSEKLRATYPRLPVHSIPTGFDPDLVPPVDVVLEGDFRLVYAGRVKGPMDPLRFLKPLAHAVSSGQIDRSRTRVELLCMGTLGPRERAFIEREGLGDVVVEADYMPREEIIRRERVAQVLLHFRWDDPREPGILTGKLFEYLAARRPVLSTGKFDDEVGAVLRSTGAGIASTDDAETERLLVDAFRAFDEAGRVPYGGRPADLERYDAGVSARRLAAILEAAASGSDLASMNRDAP